MKFKEVLNAIRKFMWAAVYVTIAVGGVMLVYGVYSSNKDRKQAVSACIEAYPNNNQVIGVIGLSVGTLCFDESGETSVFLGVLD